MIWIWCCKKKKIIKNWVLKCPFAFLICFKYCKHFNFLLQKIRFFFKQNNFKSLPIFSWIYILIDSYVLRGMVQKPKKKYEMQNNWHIETFLSIKSKINIWNKTQCLFYMIWIWSCKKKNIRNRVLKSPVIFLNCYKYCNILIFCWRK